MPSNDKSYRPFAVFLVPLLLLFVIWACGSDDEEALPATPTPAAGAPADCPPASGQVLEVEMKTYDSKPEMTIDPSKSYTAVLKTERGDVTIQLRPDLAPEHVNSFVFLAREGFYEGVTFHRVIPGFMAQGGDPTGTGSGGPGYTIPAEFTTAESFQRGTLGMARSGDPNSAGSQFFINFEPTPHLDGQYTIFGQVTGGMDVVDCLAPRDPTDPNAPPGDAILSVEIVED